MARGQQAPVQWFEFDESTLSREIMEDIPSRYSISRFDEKELISHFIKDIRNFGYDDILVLNKWIEFYFTTDSGSVRLESRIMLCDFLLTVMRSSETPSSREFALRVASNIAGQSASVRDCLIGLGIIPVLNEMSKTVSLLEPIGSCLENLCKNVNPPICLCAVSECLPMIRNLLLHNNLALVEYACSSLALISSGPTDRIQDIIDLDVVDQLFGLIRPFNGLHVLKTVAIILQNLAKGTEDQTKLLIDKGVEAALKCSHSTMLLFCIMAIDALNPCENSDEKLEKLMFSDEYLLKAVTCRYNNETLENLMRINSASRDFILPPTVRILSASNPKVLRGSLCVISTILFAASENELDMVRQELIALGLKKHLKRLWLTHSDNMVRILADEVSERCTQKRLSDLYGVFHL